MARRWIALVLGFFLAFPICAQQPKPPPSGKPPKPVISGASGGRPSASPGDPSNWTRLRGRVVPPGSISTLPEYMTVQIVARAGGPPQIQLVRNGSFEFRSIPPGDYLITLEAVGFKDVTRPVRVEYFGGPGIQIVTVALGDPLENPEGAEAPSGATVEADYLAVPAKARKELEKAQQASDRNQTKKAIQHLQKALKIHPDFYYAQNNLAAQYLKVGRNEEAADLLRAALKIKPTAQAAHNLGIALMRDDKIDEAVGPLQQAVELDQQNAGARRSLGEAYYRTGKYREAMAEFLAASEAEPNPDYQLAMGHCFLRLNDLSSAVEQYQDFLGLEPEGERADWVRGLISRIQQAQGNPH